MTHFPKIRLLIATLFAFVSSASHAADERVTVVTDIWPPYISAEGDEPGSAARMLELLLYLEGVEADWRYLPYELSLAQVSNKEELLSFPYFHSPEREEKVLFSKPIFSVTSHLYYNRQYTPDAAVADLKPQTARKGRVAGYSYGRKIDTLLADAKLYTSERDALTALFNHEIDLLPMTEGVMTALLLSHYPDRLQLIRPLPDMTDTSSLHVIAAKTPAGEQAIAKVNHALEKAESLGLDSLQPANPSLPVAVDVAVLVSAEGYPAILGEVRGTSGAAEYYTLPQGTKVLVTEWSEKIRMPSATDRIYKNMMDVSRVVVLNGPHTGKELLVRNMHIELQ